MIVLLDPASDAGLSFFHAAIFRRPHFLFLQAAMEPFDVAVALRVMVGRPPMRDRTRRVKARATNSLPATNRTRGPKLHAAGAPRKCSPGSELSDW